MQPFPCVRSCPAATTTRCTRAIRPFGSTPKSRPVESPGSLIPTSLASWRCATAATATNRCAGEAALILATEARAAHLPAGAESATLLSRSRAGEQTRRGQFPSRLHCAASAYVVQRESRTAAAGKTIIAGYPWFADWGRDTFISLRGLCLATGRLEVARDILLAWAGAVSEGMLPNRFPDRGDQPEYNSVDASLWFIVACAEFLNTGAASD